MFKWIAIASLILFSNLNAEINVLAFSGSTRTDSSNQKLVAQAADIAKQMNARVLVINLKDFPMPFYNADLEAKEGLPPAAQQLRRLMKESHVILIASPEYNGSLSGLLKNAIDWASRDEQGKPSREAFAGKKFVIMSASPGPGGGTRGLEHLRKILENVGGVVIAGQVTVPNAYDAYDAKGNLKDSKIKNELRVLVQEALKPNN